jgi:hypothetical protein
MSTGPAATEPQTSSFPFGTMKPYAMLPGLPIIALSITLVFAGSWRGVRIGKPYVDLPDMALLAHGDVRSGRHIRLGRTAAKPLGFDIMKKSLAASVAVNGLELDEETLTNGDCGLDAVLRNLERIGMTNADSVRILRLIDSKGRQHAINQMRLLLLLWMIKHKTVEIVPGVSLSSWIEMEGRPEGRGRVQDPQRSVVECT